MALSFQEAEGCAAIWLVPWIEELVMPAPPGGSVANIYIVQGLCLSGATAAAVSWRSRYARYLLKNFQRRVVAWVLSLGAFAKYMHIATDDALSDDAMDGFPNPVVLPSPELGNLGEIEQTMHVASTTPAGRDSLSKFVINDNYVQKMLPLVSIAEDLEALPDLHRLCRIMKTVILLNDTQIIEHVVSDNIVLGVVGALECKYPACRVRSLLTGCAIFR